LIKKHSLIKAKESDENLLLLKKPAPVAYVTECNESKCLNLENFRDRVPSQKEGYLILFTSAAALGNRYYLARLRLLVLLTFLRDISQRQRNGIGSGRAWKETHGKRLQQFQSALPPGRACSAGSSKASVVPLN